MLKIILVAAVTIFICLFAFLFIGKAPEAESVNWGVNFSQKHAQNLGLNWQENYRALIKDLGSKNIKVAVHWDLIEPERDQFTFSDLDWMVEKAEKHQVKLLLAVGMKTPRWPECHLPPWAKGMNKEEREEEILQFLEEITSRYRKSTAIKYWQVENEPFFPFGKCPKISKSFVKKEVELVKRVDPRHPVVITGAGESFFWLGPAQTGDIVGTTIYRKVWNRFTNSYFYYPLPPVFYWRKAQLAQWFFHKKVICVELQAEPWGPHLLYDTPLEEQSKTMNLKQFRKNINYARKTGLSEFYLWGGEWWYWMAQKQNHSSIWEEARSLFDN